MPTFESHEPGSPCWVDLSTPDVDAAKAYLQAVFGWTGEDQFDGEGNRIYTNLLLDGRLVCGLGGQAPGMDGAPAMWSTYVCVTDAAATAEQVTAAGGSVLMPPMQIMDVGHMAVFADPAGAAISVWQPRSHTGAEVANEPNTWSWNELLTRDLQTAQPFYTEVFGWEYDAQDMGPMGTYHVIRGGENGGWGGMMSMPPGMPDMVPNHWVVYFTTDDVDATLAAVVGNGGEVVNGPDDVPGVGRMAQTHHAQGGSFAVLQPESAG